MFSADERNMVDAIEDGRIVRVTEEYARREGLMIIRRPEKSALDSEVAQKEMKLTPRLRGERKAYFDIDKYRRPWHDKNEILASLVDNFHWIVSSRRKQMNMNRKQLAQEINASEEDLKMLENGSLPASDYVLINKLENYLKINLRKDKMLASTASGFSAREHSISKPKWSGKIGVKKEERAEELVDSDIELIDGEEDKLS